MRISKWLPSLLVMLVIFLFSAQSSSSLPSFDWADRAVKKGGHILGYALLAWTYWHGFDYRKDKRWLSWFFAVLYAVTDELHQSLVPGRRASVWDVVIFDNLGALISLWFADKYIKRSGQSKPDR